VLYRAVPRRGVSVRLAGIYASNLEPAGKSEQLTLFTAIPEQSENRRRLGQVLDQLTARYGEDIVRIGETRSTAPKRSQDPASSRKEELLDPLTRGKKER
jgi:hypothetical protein